jgi:hypothetical protein
LTESGFKGTYHHWDSYPEALGQTLWNLYHGHFARNMEDMVQYLLAHNWSTINDRDFDSPPGYGSKGPECYCHGQRSEGMWDLDETNAAESGCEYAYAFDVETRKMHILSSRNGDGSKMIGFFGSGNPEATWHAIAAIDLDGEEPDWGTIG